MAGLTGLLVGGWWAYTRPLDLDPVSAGGVGVVLGAAMYGVIVLVHTIDTARNA